MNNLLEIINRVLDSNDKDVIDNISDSINLKNDLGFDSFMLAELTVEIEEETGIDIFKDGMIFTISDILKKLNG
jgi:acyl carrier protein